MDLYHRTSAESAKAIRETGVFTSKEYDRSVYFSNRRADDSQATGYGEEVVHVRLPDSWIAKGLVELDDEFPDGEEHYRIDAMLLTKTIASGMTEVD